MVASGEEMERVHLERRHGDCPVPRVATVGIGPYRKWFEFEKEVLA
jgi:hypothetical protein